MAFIIFATNIHNGGGSVLLDELLTVDFEGAQVELVVDARYSLSENLPANIKVTRVSPKILHRLRAELSLAHTAAPADLVLCFGNLPPLFRLKAKTAVFVQNRYLIDNMPLIGFSLRTKIRLTVERFWLKLRCRNAQLYCVQTPTMADLIRKNELSQGVTIKVVPFASLSTKRAATKNVATGGMGEMGFVYVASGEPHKNHKVLIEAWKLLAAQGLYPKLKLTIDPTQWPDLSAQIELQTRTHSLQIENMGFLSQSRIQECYENSAALIYPSNLESFGLPLVEATQADLPVLAPELDYVRDVIRPAETFDAASPVSIARAVKRFLKIDEIPNPVISAKDFISTIQNEFR